MSNLSGLGRIVPAPIFHAVGNRPCFKHKLKIFLIITLTLELRFQRIIPLTRSFPLAFKGDILSITSISCSVMGGKGDSA